MLDSPFRQLLSRSSLVFLLVLGPLLHTPCISSPNHHLQTIHIAPKSKIESRAHYAQEPVRATELNWTDQGCQEWVAWLRVSSHPPEWRHRQASAHPSCRMSARVDDTDDAASADWSAPQTAVPTWPTRHTDTQSMSTTEPLSLIWHRCTHNILWWSKLHHSCKKLNALSVVSAKH